MKYLFVIEYVPGYHHRHVLRGSYQYQRPSEGATDLRHRVRLAEEDSGDVRLREAGGETRQTSGRSWQHTLPGHPELAEEVRELL